MKRGEYHFALRKEKKNKKQKKTKQN